MGSLTHTITLLSRTLFLRDSGDSGRKALLARFLLSGSWRLRCQRAQGFFFWTWLSTGSGIMLWGLVHPEVSQVPSWTMGATVMSNS